MTVRLNSRDQLEPDIVVAMCPFVPDRTWFVPADVLLAVEVVVPETERRDRTIKPRRYAAAGIPHFWLVENRNHQAVVHVHELSGSAYILREVATGTLERPVPFPLTINLGPLVS